MTAKTKIEAESENVIFVPLNRLKKSPKNARKTPHAEAEIEALAASIAAKGLLQNLVVEPERDADDKETGHYLVTIGEGLRLAQLLRVKRKQIKKTEPIRCVLDTEHDAHEISLAENVVRTRMHPADKFEAFKQLAEDRGMSAEDIAARFGEHPEVALIAATHALAAQVYYDEQGSCLTIRADQPSLISHAEGIEDTPSAKTLSDRHANWARQLPEDVNDLWAFVVALDADGRMALLAHCVASTVNVVSVAWATAPCAGQTRTPSRILSAST